MEPQPDRGYLNIKFNKITAPQKQSTALTALQCLLYRGDDKIIDERFHQKEGRFQISLNALPPSDQYALLLWGSELTGTTAARIFKDEIVVIAGDTTELNLSWEPFSIIPVSPESGLATNQTSPEFAWQTTGTVGQCQLQIDTTNRFVVPLFEQDSLFLHSLTLPITLEDGTYFWRLRALDVQGHPSTWMRTSSFSIDTESPDSPILKLPEDQSTFYSTNIIFDWEDTEGVHHYHIQMDEEAAFINPRYNMPFLLDSEMFVSSFTNATFLPDPGTYFWRVRGCDKVGNWGNWSTPFQFTYNGTE